MVFALVRHGQTDWNLQRRMQGTSDIPLNELGRSQARAAGELLAEQSWDVVVSSPLGRARETAEIIASITRAELAGTYDELMEQHFGIAEGMFVEDVIARWPDWEWPTREPDHEVGPRGLRGLDAVHAEYGDANVLVVAHGTLIRSTIAEISGLHRDVFPYLDNCASAHVHRHVEHGWRALTFGGEPVEAVLSVTDG